MSATAGGSHPDLDGSVPKNEHLTGPRVARSRALWIGVVVAAALLVLALVLDPGLRLRVFETTRAVLKVLGEAQLAKIDAMDTGQDGTSEYLVVLKERSMLESAQAFVDAQSTMRYEGESVYPRAFRVRLDVPVSDAKRALEAQSFVGMVLPVTPFLFCH